MRVLLVTPPMVQVNAPYPATAYLKGILAGSGHTVIQEDASLALALRLFSREGLEQIRVQIRATPRAPSTAFFLRHFRQYHETIADVMAYLQTQSPRLARKIRSRGFLPQGLRFAPLRNPHHADLLLASLSPRDRATYLASLYLDDLADTIRAGVDPYFELARYAEKLAASASHFDGLSSALRGKPTLVRTMTEAIASELIHRHAPDIVGFTLPFPGNLYAALLMARAMKRIHSGLQVVLGGGYVNTELRSLTEPRLFDFADFITLDDGEAPLRSILQYLQNGATTPQILVRTFIRQKGRVRFMNSTRPQPSSPTIAPDFVGLPLNQYFSMIESPNPMHRIWSCERWNKIMLARGCYWHRCAFCDTHLDYIGNYKATPVDELIDQIRKVMKQTGKSGFHFIDEAMPPALLRQLSHQLIRKRIRITWWGNVRFDQAFTPDLAALMARAGCMAVTGGLEAPTNRLLTLLDKGFSLEQATRVLAAFSSAGIMVHAYLMYGLPSQSPQDTVDSLEYVRQLFDAGLIHSAYWHRFALTVHSPIFAAPQAFGIRLIEQPRAPFARNEVPYMDSLSCDHERLGVGLRKSLYNYMHAAGVDLALQDWFDFPTPPPSLPVDFVASHATPLVRPE